MTTRTLVLAAVCAAVLAGCTVSSSGDPSPTSTASGNPSTSESVDPKFADLLPPRTRELDLSGVDPCKDLLSEQQLRELDYDFGYARPPGPGTSVFSGGPNCTFGATSSGRDNRNIRTVVGISTAEGAMAWLTDPERVPEDRPEVVSIGDFHALVLHHPALPDNCMVVVDTADGQYLDVTSTRDTGEDTTYDPYCAEAERVAGMAIQTISKSR